MVTVILLTISNIFMTFAWYGHLKYRNASLFKVILISCMIAFFEYCFQVPANRIGSYEFTAAQLKTIQEVITLTVFSRFFRALSERTAEMELRSGFRDDRGRGGCDLQEVVRMLRTSEDARAYIAAITESANSDVPALPPTSRVSLSRWL